MNNIFDAKNNKVPAQFRIITPEKLADESANICGIVTAPSIPIDSRLINSLPNLKIISCFGTGVDAVDLSAAKSKNIIVTNTPDVVTEDTADIAIALLMSLARRIVFYDNYVRSGKWKKTSAPLGTTISGKTLGVIGLGKIGKRVAEKAAGLGLKIIYHTRTPKDVSYGYYDNLLAMANDSDFLVATVPGGDETRNMINLNVLKALGEKGFFINISRGTTVNEKDLIDALQNKIIAGAGLDVYLNEPNIAEEFMQMEQVILLPHIGSATKETRKIMVDLVIDNLRSYFETGKALTAV